MGNSNKRENSNCWGKKYLGVIEEANMAWGLALKKLTECSFCEREHVSYIIV